jgi:hypothetical protein
VAVDEDKHVEEGVEGAEEEVKITKFGKYS